LQLGAIDQKPEPKDQSRDRNAIANKAPTPRSAVAPVKVITNQTSTDKENRPATENDVPKPDWFGLTSDSLTARSTVILTAATIILGALTGALVRYTRATIRETRRIGEAQVRAYISIEKAWIDFAVPKHGKRGDVRIGITAKNRGQSPARDFKWTPTLQFSIDGRKRKRGVERDILAESGIVISAGDESDVFEIVGDMTIDEFADASGIKRAPDIITRIEIVFEYVDVFDRKTPGIAYFVGEANDMNGRAFGAQPIGSVGNWVGTKMRATVKPANWDAP
jgi:hypothetical protein